MLSCTFLLNEFSELWMYPFSKNSSILVITVWLAIIALTMNVVARATQSQACSWIFLQHPELFWVNILLFQLTRHRNIQPTNSTGNVTSCDILYSTNRRKLPFKLEHGLISPVLICTSWMISGLIAIHCLDPDQAAHISYLGLQYCSCRTGDPLRHCALCFLNNDIIYS